MAMVKQTTQVNLNNYASNQGSSNSNSPLVNPDELLVNKPLPSNKSEASKNYSQSEQQEKEELTREDISQLTEHLNQIMTAINTDLQFKLHEGTDRLMVQFVNTQDNQVIKEFPPHELLDTLAAIRNYVGILLDKKV